MFRGEYQPLSEDGMKLLASLLMSRSEPEIPEEELPFFAKVVKKRIEVADLPIRFAPSALFGLLALTDRVGGAVIILIDALNKFVPEAEYQHWLKKEPYDAEPRTITAGDLCQLYPMGFYNEKSLEDYIDNYLKAHRPDTPEEIKEAQEGKRKPVKVRWAELY